MTSASFAGTVLSPGARFLPAPARHGSDGLRARVLNVLGVQIIDTTKAHAIELMRTWIDSFRGRPRSIFIVNAHTLNLAWEDPEYRRILNSSDVTFSDGTGVRLAARLEGVSLRDNLVGTDLIPSLMERYPGRYRYFLLGGPKGKAERAAEGVERLIPGARIAGVHHGFISENERGAAIERINAAQPDVLLVGMGNPHQETWIHHALPRLRVPISVGVGGLFDYWAGELERAPLWVRRLGVEWCYIMLHHRHKWRRYLLGNPKFLWRALQTARGRRPLDLTTLR
ncbi:MAG TPA: WecB/TagA/CpsF family glycosyltransferase [Terriglobales bacterium]|nr:WecB/TagA/CpsF family glycosyltransferase [Terriglobales bacterium]